MEIQWSLVIFSLLAGTGGALLAFLAIAEVQNTAEKVRKPALVCALALLIIGGCASVLHLAQPSNIMAAAANVFSFSGISIELIALGVTAILAVVYLAMAGRDNAGAVKGIAVAAGIFGLILGFATGNGYVIPAQPNWDTVLVPFTYLASDVVTAGLVYLALASSNGVESSQLKQTVIIACVAVVVQAILYLLYGASLSFAVEAVPYWVLAIALGCIGSFVLVALMWRNGSSAPVASVGAVCALAGGVGLRMTMWIVGFGILNLFSAAAGFAIL